jgi:hypothetical protein
MGVFEMSNFAAGTNAIAQILANITTIRKNGWLSNKDDSHFCRYLTFQTSKAEVELWASREFIEGKLCATYWMEIQLGT